MENLELDSSFGEKTEVPMPNVSTNSLKKIIEYMEHYQDTPQPSAEEIKDKLAETISTWDEDFLRMPLQELYDLVS
jgi:S-phase kinase-associated protein 1